eukprot:CAMPEP_0205807030 /NCGR_PEP_ID=MMETSP0205-20121125/10699_1 /ASSEMBLY_ACC=CAM_ASM_000278 /TAXON_ID=36767 /ORGANISM="Euplotes focardii, Strain TN1" /LENGTH=119 /DNA_ID=CAMNT_0053080731 /DNA_START=400 /DNA_END=756 /DNA_ORIENTATION=+
MKEDLKVRLAKKDKIVKKEMDFEFVGVEYGDPVEESKDLEETAPPTDGNDSSEEETYELVQDHITKYSTNLHNFLDEENLSEEADEKAMAETPKLMNMPSEDRDNVYNNELDESVDKSE